MSAFLSPSNLQDKTSARLLTPSFHGGAESRRQMREQRDLTSPQMPHGKTHCVSMQPPPQSGVLLCAEHNHLAPHSFTGYQPLISGCRVYGTTSYSHDNSPSSVYSRYLLGSRLVFAEYLRQVLQAGRSVLSLPSAVGE